ncbi:DUF1778 domain-containing protein [Microbacterium sp. BF1]|uniref:type II toxin-antitoxin system TacA family antitoxin n=1 Tax=Microbacterium sp. BF1 TaxID=2821146 RepID=UPI001C4E083E|nr:DUF1778 domain-containing protein [Microbacterium sp. BF1]
MATATAPNSARVNMRISSSALEVIDEAATLQGIDRTAFFIDAAVTRARKVISEERLRVTATEVEQIKRLLSDDQDPTEALRSAAQRLADLGL